MLQSWAGLAEGVAEAVVKPPIAGIVEDALNSPNPAYFLGGKTADAAITAPTLMFGGEGALARSGLGEVEGTGLLPHPFPDHTPPGTGGHLPVGTGDHPLPHHGPLSADLLPDSSHLGGAPDPSGIELDMRLKDGWNPDQVGAMRDKIDRFNQAVADGGFQQVDPMPRNPVIRQPFLDSLGLDRVPPGMHVDHIRDLQAGGLDSFENMMLLDGSVNMSFGKQLNFQMSQYDAGTIFSLLRLLEGNR